MKSFRILAAALLLPLSACGETTDEDVIRTMKTHRDSEERQMIASNDSIDKHEKTSPRHASSGETDTAMFGAGCFWCVEAVFERLDGVLDVVAGYAGGHVEHPTYEQVCTGSTGHAEVARITFDPGIVTFEDLLEVFWQAHDPTTLNRQGADVGTQYRSAIFYHSEEQRAVAEASKKAVQEYFDDPVVTEITPLERFWEAENYHQDYFNNNRNAPYCRVVIQPKLKKLKLE